MESNGSIPVSLLGSISSHSANPFPPRLSPLIFPNRLLSARRRPLSRFKSRGVAGGGWRRPYNCCKPITAAPACYYFTERVQYGLPNSHEELRVEEVGLLRRNEVSTLLNNSRAITRS
eukprot:GHVU01134058.1.p1 GENE.GHVU01134058.1~~GHVU01134058.1.p1  ORF type:complete len:118 (+),score=0.27 GHVU01134058.1:394-747(+)